MGTTGRAGRRGRALARQALCLLLAATVPAGTGRAAEPPLVAPEGGPWPSGDGFAFDARPKKTRRSVSGVACPREADPSGRRTCLVAFDEGVEARFATLGPGRLVPLAEQVVLRSGGGELDAEGAALDGESFYVTGSHAAKRGDCASNPGSRHVVRFRRDPATGRALREPSGRLALPESDASRLWALMARIPALAPHVGEGRCLGTEPPEDAPRLKGQRGVNIEGLAAAGGRLTFGFRGPAMAGRAPVLAVDAAGLFGAGPENAALTFLELGERRGIRDLQAVTGGLLILAGPDDDEASAGAGWAVGFWDGTATDGVGRPTMLARLDLRGLVRKECDEEIKPEAVAVVEESPDAFRIVVLSDGMCDGGPVAFRIRR